MNRKVTQSEFARICGVSRQVVSRTVKTVLKPAFSDGRIDLNHDIAIDYLVKHDVDLTSSAVVDMGDGNVIDEGMLSEIPLARLVVRFGSIEEVNKHLDAEKKQNDIIAQNLKNEVSSGKLIDAEFAYLRFVSPLVGTLNKLLSDVPQSVSPDIVARCEVGGDDVEIAVRTLLHDSISKVLQGDIQRYERELNAR